MARYSKTRKPSSAHIRLIKGTALDVQALLGKETVDCVITSPPYWGKRDYGVREQIGTEASIERYTAHLVRVFSGVKEVLKPRGTCWINLGDGYSNGHRRYRAKDRKAPHRQMSTRLADPAGIKPKELFGLPWRVISALQRDGWYVRAEIIWNKPNALPESVKDRPMRAHEFIFLLTKSPHYTFRHGRLSRAPGQVLRSVWNFPVGVDSESNGHPAAFPLGLATQLLDLSCTGKRVVLDPFCGSGTTGVAAVRRGFSFVGIDISARFLKTAQARLKRAERGKRLMNRSVKVRRGRRALRKDQNGSG